MRIDMMTLSGVKPTNGFNLLERKTLDGMEIAIHEETQLLCVVYNSVAYGLCISNLERIGKLSNTNVKEHYSQQADRVVQYLENADDDSSPLTLYLVVFILSDRMDDYNRIKPINDRLKEHADAMEAFRAKQQLEIESENESERLNMVASMYLDGNKIKPNDFELLLKRHAIQISPKGLGWVRKKLSVISTNGNTVSYEAETTSSSIADVAIKLYNAIKVHSTT